MGDVDTVLARVLADLAPDVVERTAVNRARVEVDGRSLHLRLATRGRMLLRITETTFEVTGPAWSAPEPIEVEVGHRGAVRRTGLRIRVVSGGDRARTMAAALSADEAFRAAVMPLDCTSFRIAVTAGHLCGAITLMGASMTRMRVPPSATVVGLHDDQRTALLATIDALATAWVPA